MDNDWEIEDDSQQSSEPEIEEGEGPEGVEDGGGDSEADSAASKSDKTQCSDSEASKKGEPIGGMPILRATLLMLLISKPRITGTGYSDFCQSYWFLSAACQKNCKYSMPQAHVAHAPLCT